MDLFVVVMVSFWAIYALGIAMTVVVAGAHYILSLLK
jgi:hypothetical protein